MAEDRDQMLAFFQACTGIEDVAVALSRLESSNWNLMTAIDEVIPENAPNRTNNSSPDVEMIQEIRHTDKAVTTENIDDSDDDSIVVVDPVPTVKKKQTKPDDENNWRVHLINSASTSKKPTVQISPFRVKLIFENETSTLLEIPRTWTVMNLKKEIQTQMKIPACRQIITGWPGHYPKDSDSLSDMNCSELTLYVRDTSAESSTSDIFLNFSRTYLLKIKNLTKAETIELPYSGAKTIRELKYDIFNLSDIPVRLQEWTGWPAPVTDDEQFLGQLGLDFPEHHLTVNARSQTSSQECKKSKRTTQTDDSDESSIGEYEDAPETFGVDDLFAPARGIVKPLSKLNLTPHVPPKTEDEAVGCLQFAEEFVNRYGPVHPEFFPGNLENAIKEACMKPARERRLLALYLHHDRSVFSNVFCTEILCRESVIQVLATYFILWGWDLTCAFNKDTFFKSFEKELGSMAAVQIRDIPEDRLPAVIIINRVRSGLEIMSVIQGNIAINDLLASLTETMDVFLEQQKVEGVEEDKRNVREMIKMQQDAAFRESLEMDRAKEEARRNQEVAENQEKQRERVEREEAAAVKEAERQSVVSRLPQEPAETAAAITKIRVRLPKGEFLERRFNETDTLQTLLDWLHVQGFRSVDYKFLSSWPRRDLTAADSKITLKDHSLCPQETVIIEER